MQPLNLSAPTSWSELSQEQLRFLLRTIVAVNRTNSGRAFDSRDDFAAHTAAQVAVYCLFRWNGVSVLTPYADAWLVAHDGRELVISADDIAAATSFLSWTAETPSSPVRLHHIDGADAVEASLDDDFSFDDWLSCETLWQGYQATQNTDFLRQMAEILYRKPGISLREYEILSIFYWWAGLKSECSRLYSYFLRPSAPSENTPEVTQDSLRRNIDAQIRALTKGDITKEATILSLPAHRALTELDALAREYDELNRKSPSK